ncbi:hypothetical protein GGR57DRAFT_518852 [Xylariaceae sp. FL1272]|nr:hypothetical protein GGR57DRAFT_518852 [Xylariaceae sp. FL1272]
MELNIISSGCRPEDGSTALEGVMTSSRSSDLEALPTELKPLFFRVETYLESVQQRYHYSQRYIIKLVYKLGREGWTHCTWESQLAPKIIYHNIPRLWRPFVDLNYRMHTLVHDYFVKGVVSLDPVMKVKARLHEMPKWSASAWHFNVPFMRASLVEMASNNPGSHWKDYKHIASLKAAQSSLNSHSVIMTYVGRQSALALSNAHTVTQNGFLIGPLSESEQLRFGRALYMLDLASTSLALKYLNEPVNTQLYNTMVLEQLFNDTCPWLHGHMDQVLRLLGAHVENVMRRDHISLISELTLDYLSVADETPSSLPTLPAAAFVLYEGLSSLFQLEERRGATLQAWHEVNPSQSGCSKWWRHVENKANAMHFSQFSHETLRYRGLVSLNPGKIMQNWLDDDEDGKATWYLGVLSEILDHPLLGVAARFQGNGNECNSCVNLWAWNMWDVKRLDRAALQHLPTLQQMRALADNVTQPYNFLITQARDYDSGYCFC